MSENFRALVELFCQPIIPFVPNIIFSYIYSLVCNIGPVSLTSEFITTDGKLSEHCISFLYTSRILFERLDLILEADLKQTSTIKMLRIFTF